MCLEVRGMPGWDFNLLTLGFYLRTDRTHFCMCLPEEGVESTVLETVVSPGFLPGAGALLRFLASGTEHFYCLPLFSCDVSALEPEDHGWTLQGSGAK